ncbi:hypothetical protein U0L90_05625, partial [Flavobacteriaceae sp. LMIT009]
MKNLKTIKTKLPFLMSLVLFAVISCERDLPENANEAEFSSNAEVFIDGFSGGLEYYPYADSKQTAFSVDDDAFKGSSSMRFDIPNAGDPEGAYAGAIFRDDNGGRNLTDYDALTFWAKGSEARTINDIGFGQDFFENKYEVSVKGSLQLTTNWVKYTIPIPDASKLVQEKGMFWYAEGPNDDGTGYSFWIDELKFEKLGTIAHAEAMIYNGVDEVVNTFIGVSFSVEGLIASFNLANGVNQVLNLAPAYFDFTSTDPSVATITESGNISVIGEGSTTITASFLGEDVPGSLVVNSSGEFTSAPVPTNEPEDVISIFSDAYNNVPVEFFNGYWQPFQTTESTNFAANNDNVISYTNFNFVGNQFGNPTIDASQMEAIHFDVFVPEGTVDPQLAITLKDFGPNGQDGGDDDTTFTQTFSGSTLLPGQWNALEITFNNLSNRNRFGQIIYENLGSGLTSFYLDNVYCYKTPGSGGGGGVCDPETEESTAAADLNITFQTNTPAFIEDNATFSWIDNPDADGSVNNSCKVGQVTRANNSPWDNLQIDLADKLDFNSSEGIKMKVWSPIANTPVLFKLEEIGNSGNFVEILQNTGPANTWTELTFDFASTPTPQFNKIVIFFNFNVADGSTYYFDDIKLYGSSGGGGGGTAPTTAAPTPTQAEADVISV